MKYTENDFYDELLGIAYYVDNKEPTDTQKVLFKYLARYAYKKYRIGFNEARAKQEELIK